MKYEEFKKLRKEFGEDWGVQLANEMVCGTGGNQYCDHFIKQAQYTPGSCKLGLISSNRVGWKCSKNTIELFVFKKPEKKPEKKPPDISKWF